MKKKMDRVCMVGMCEAPELFFVVEIQFKLCIIRIKIHTKHHHPPARPGFEDISNFGTCWEIKFLGEIF